jgi:hypothetical protein
MREREREKKKKPLLSNSIILMIYRCIQKEKYLYKNDEFKVQ